MCKMLYHLFLIKLDVVFTFYISGAEFTEETWKQLYFKLCSDKIRVRITSSYLAGLNYFPYFSYNIGICCLSGCY